MLQTKIDFRSPKIHQNQLLRSFAPDPTWGSLHHSPRLLSSWGGDLLPSPQQTQPHTWPFRDIAFDRSKIAIFGYPLAFNPPPSRWRGSLHHITESDISLKQDALGYISVAESLNISSTTFTKFAAKATEFAEITQNNGHYAIQGYSRSLIFVPMESSYATSY